MDFGKILTRAWEIIRKHKVLWIFGIFAGLAGGGTSFRFNYNTSSYQIDQTEINNLPPEMQKFFEGVLQFFETNQENILTYVILIVLGLTVLGFAFYLLRIFGQAGLIRGVLEVEKGTQIFTFSELAAMIRPFFWRLVGLNLLIFAVTFGAFLLFVLAALPVTVLTFGIGLACFAPLICLLAPLSWVLSLVLWQASIALVAEDLSIGDALRRGWELVRYNPASYLVMAFLLFLGSAIIGYIISLPMLVALAPMFAGMIGGAFLQDWGGLLNGLGISLVCLVVYTPVLLVLNGILTAFVHAGWVLTYLEIVKPADEEEEPDQVEPGSVVEGE